jgi:putative oxidoreductase
MKFLNGLQPLSLLFLRVCLAIIFVSHGYPKLVRSNEGMREFFVQHGLPGYFVGLAGILECFGGMLLVVGLFTRPAALLLASEMAVAIWKVHGVHGVLAVREYEFPLALCAACIGLATVGAGSLSLDHAAFGNGSRKRQTPRNAKK